MRQLHQRLVVCRQSTTQSNHDSSYVSQQPRQWHVDIQSCQWKSKPLSLLTTLWSPLTASCHNLHTSLHIFLTSTTTTSSRQNTNSSICFLPSELLQLTVRCIWWPHSEDICSFRTVAFRLMSVPVQLIAWRDSSLKLPSHEVLKDSKNIKLGVQ